MLAGYLIEGEGAAMAGDRVIAMRAEIGGQGLRSGINDQIGVIGADHRGSDGEGELVPANHTDAELGQVVEHVVAGLDLGNAGEIALGPDARG